MYKYIVNRSKRRNKILQIIIGKCAAIIRTNGLLKILTKRNDDLIWKYIIDFFMSSVLAITFVISNVNKNDKNISDLDLQMLLI